MPELSQEIWMGLAALAALIFIGGGAWLLRSRQPALEDPDDGLEALTDGGTAPPPPDTGLAARFFRGLARSRDALAASLAGVVGSGGSVDEDALEALEDALIGADVGVTTATQLTDVLREAAQTDGEDADLRELLRSELLTRIGGTEPIATQEEGPLVILVVGVNGSGKTTTIGKLAARYVREGKKVMLAAGDTFRAGAIEQLKVWGDRSGVPVIAGSEGGDPAAVAFDAARAAAAREVDVLICDTAGRLQAQKTLMDELGKVTRVIGKAMPGAPHEVLLVLDATIGQNALSQAKVFKEVVGVTGVALTKLDGTARGGVVVAVRQALGIPVKLVGLGEGIDDLRDFAPEAFVDALLGEDDATKR